MERCNRTIVMKKPPTSLLYGTNIYGFLVLASFSFLLADCFVLKRSTLTFIHVRRRDSQCKVPRQHAKRKKSTAGGNSSPTGSMLDFAFKASRFGNNKSSKNAVQSGIDGALILTDARRRNEFKKDLKKQFPWMPSAFVDSCIDLLSDSFSNVAPADLKKALKPGGLETVRPKLENEVVTSLRNQPVLQNLPLSEKDKSAFLTYMVSMSLDFLFKDVQETLQAPSLKLSTMDRQMREIQKYMTIRQHMWYRIRYRPLQTTSLGLLCVWTIYLSYQQYKHTVLVSCLTGICLKAVTTAKTLCGTITNVLFKGSAKRKGLKRKAAPRAWGR